MIIDYKVKYLKYKKKYTLLKNQYGGMIFDPEYKYVNPFNLYNNSLLFDNIHFLDNDINSSKLVDS